MLWSLNHCIQHHQCHNPQEVNFEIVWESESCHLDTFSWIITFTAPIIKHFLWLCLCLVDHNTFKYGFNIFLKGKILVIEIKKLSVICIWVKYRSDTLTDGWEPESSPGTGESARVSPCDARKQPGGNTMRLLEAGRDPPGIAMETAEVGLELGQCHASWQGSTLNRSQASRHVF